MVMGGVGMPLPPGEALAITTRTALSHPIVGYNRGYPTLWSVRRRAMHLHTCKGSMVFG